MCLVFFLWFASGIVMMYVEYPMLTEQERIRSLSPLEIDAIEIEVSALEKRIKPEQRVIGFSITSHLDRPVFHAQFGDGTTLVMFADTGETLGPTTESSAVEAARIFARNSALGATARYLEALEMDQWTVYGGFSSHRPLHKVALSVIIFRKNILLPCERILFY